jgi:hypothetical protein
MESSLRGVPSTAPAASRSGWVRGILPPPPVVPSDLLEASQESSGHLFHLQESVVVGRKFIGLLTIKEKSC